MSESISITSTSITAPSTFYVTASWSGANTALSPSITFDLNGVDHAAPTTGVAASGTLTKSGIIPPGVSSFTATVHLRYSGTSIVSDSYVFNIDAAAPIITSFSPSGTGINTYNNVYYSGSSAIPFSVSVDGTGSAPKTYEVTTSATPSSGGSAISGVSGTTANFTITVNAAGTNAPETWYLHIKDEFNNAVTRQIDVHVIPAASAPAGTVTTDLTTTTPDLWENPTGSAEYYANTTAVSAKIDIAFTSPIANLFPSSDPTLYWIITSGTTIPTTKTAPNGTQFIGSSTAAHTGGGTISITPTFNLTANTWSSIDIYARDLAYNITLLDSVEIFADLAGPEVTTSGFTPATSGIDSTGAPVSMSYPHEIDLDNIVTINQYIPSVIVKDEHSGLATAKLDVGDPVYNTFDDYTTSYPQIAKNVGNTTVPIALWPFQFTAIDHTLFPDWTHANTTSSGSPTTTITDSFAQPITWEDGEFGLFCRVNYYIETDSDPAILTDATNDGYGKIATFELAYTSSSGTTEVQFFRDPNEQGFMAFPRVEFGIEEAIIIYRDGTSDTGGTLTATMQLEGRSTSAFAKGMYEIEFIGKLKAIPGTGYPITVVANDYFNNITTDTSMSIPIVKKPTISEFGFSDYFQPKDLPNDQYYTNGVISWFAEFKSGIPVERIALYSNASTFVDQVTSIGKYIGRIDRSNVSLPSTGLFAGFLRIEDEDGNSDFKLCFLYNVIPSNFNPTISATLDPSVNTDGSGNILDSYIKLRITITNPTHTISSLVPVSYYKITNDSTIMSSSSMTAFPPPPSIGSPFTSLPFSVPTGTQPNTFNVRIHVMDFCGNVKYQDFAFTSDSLALTPSGKIKSTALTQYKDSFDPVVYKLLTVETDPRRVEPQQTSKLDGSGSVKDPGLTDNGRLLQLNKGTAIWSSYLGERQAADTNYIEEVRSTGSGDVITTQESRFYSNRFPGVNKYIDSEYVGYQNNEAESGSIEDIGDVLRVKNDSFELDDTIEDNKLDNNAGTLTLTDQG